MTSFSVAICMKKTKILFGQLNCSVKLADVSTRCSSHPQPERIFALFNLVHHYNNYTLWCGQIYSVNYTEFLNSWKIIAPPPYTRPWHFSAHASVTLSSPVLDGAPHPPGTEGSQLQASRPEAEAEVDSPREVLVDSYHRRLEDQEDSLGKTSLVYIGLSQQKVTVDVVGC